MTYFACNSMGKTLSYNLIDDLFLDGGLEMSPVLD
jgi:hypothetical protein